MPRASVHGAISGAMMWSMTGRGGRSRFAISCRICCDMLIDNESVMDSTENDTEKRGVMI